MTIRQVYVSLNPRPKCPKCENRMQLNRPKKDQSWLPFWGCERFPRCDGTVRATLKDPEKLAVWDYPVDWLSVWVYK